MTSLSLLPISADDLSFVGEMLRVAAFWRDDDEAPSVADLLRQPDLAVYLDGWGRPGDAGLVAHVDGEPIGAVWVRRFRDDAHGAHAGRRQCPRPCRVRPSKWCERPDKRTGKRTG